MPTEEQCSIEFLEGIKSVLGKADGKSVLKSIVDRSKILKDSGATDNDAITQAAKEFADRTKEIGQQATREQLSRIKTYNDLVNHVSKFKNPVRGLLSLLGGVEGSSVKAAKNSVDAAQKEAYGRLAGRFGAMLRGAKLVEAFHDTKNHLDLMREMYDPGITDNVEAKKLSSIVKKVYGTGRALLNKMGAAVADMNEYVGRQMHNPEKMLKLSEDAAEHRKLLKEIRRSSADAAERRQKLIDASYDVWSKYILPRIDQERTFAGTSDPDSFLKSMFSNIVEGRYDSQTGSIGKGDLKFTGPQNIAKKISSRRIMHFKDGQAAFEYNARYGHGSFPVMFDRTINGMGRNIGMMRKFGTNPRSLFNKLKQDVERMAKKTGIPKSKISRQLGRSENIFREVSGELHTPVDNMLAKIGVGFRIAQVLSKMGSVTLSALPDIGNKADQLRANGMGFLESESKALFGTLKGLDKEKNYVADLCGTYFESLPQQFAHQFGTTDGAMGKMSKLMQTSYNMSGITMLDQINRKSFTHTLARHLVLESKKKFGGLAKSLQNTLNEHGIAEKEWDLLRKEENIQRPFNNKRFITPDGARYFTDDSIREYLRKPDATAKEIADVKDTMEFNLRTYFINNSDNINMMAQATERAIMHQGLDPNTTAGQAMRLIMQFKGFGISMTRRKLGRIFGDAVENGWKMGNIFTLSNTQQVVQMAISLTAYGYLALSMKDLIAGKTPRDPKMLKTWFSSFMQGGAAGLYGDFLLGNYERGAGQSFTDSFGGATLDTINQVWDLFSRLERMDHPGTAAYHLFRNNLPFVNLWYAKAAFNYLFLYGIQEKINPGSLSRMQSNLENNYGQHFMLDPTMYAKQF